MATKNLNQLTTTASAASGDLVAIWRVGDGDTRAITKANFMGGVLTGGGTIATGGFTLTVAAASTINGSLVGNMTGGGTVATGGNTLTVGGASSITGTLSGAGTVATGGNTLTVGGTSTINGSLVGSMTGSGTVATGGSTLTVGGTSTINGSLVGSMTGSGTVATGGFTLTVPATGTASLLGTAQTYSALKTFSSGINTGQATNLTHFDVGSWTPAITGSAGDPTITYTTQLANYLRINTWIFFAIEIAINTISGGSGTTRISLPVAPTKSRATFAETSGADFTTGSQSFFRPQSGVLYGILGSTGDNVSETAIVVTSLAAGDLIQVQGFYEA